MPSAQEVPLRPTEVAVATAEDRGGAETPCAVRLSQATVSAVGIVGSSCELGGSTHEASPPLSPIICTSAPPMRRRRVPSTPRSPTCSASSGSPSSMVPMKKGGMMKGACKGGNKSSGLASMQSVQVDTHICLHGVRWIGDACSLGWLCMQSVLCVLRFQLGFTAGLLQFMYAVYTCRLARRLTLDAAV